jgi:RNA polymerase sigma factor (sigma-70 family)
MIPTDKSAGTTAELRQLYRKWPDVRQFLKTLGCSGQEAEDIFQEALLIYIRKKEESDFELSAEPFFYVRNTCKLLWYNQSRKTGKQMTFSLESDVEQPEESWLAKESKLSAIERALQQMGKQCRELLQLFYGLGWNMSEIAEKIGLRNDKVAKAQKYRCLQKAKELVRNQPETHVELFNSMS